jgi:hypothetical protein
MCLQGWQRERVAWRSDGGARIVHVAPGDPAAHAAKAVAVACHVSAGLALPPGWLLPAEASSSGGLARVHAFLLVSPAGVVDGACFAEPLARAHRVAVAPSCADGDGARASNEGVLCYERAAEAAGAGIRAIWVAAAARRQGAACALLDAAARALAPHAAAPLARAALAFSQPTAAGRALAQRYAGTPAFLVYTDADVGAAPEAALLLR